MLKIYNCKKKNITVLQSPIWFIFENSKTVFTIFTFKINFEISFVQRRGNLLGKLNYTVYSTTSPEGRPRQHVHHCHDSVLCNGPTATLPTTCLFNRANL